MNEIFLPILEMRNSSVRQKLVLLNIFSRLCLEPQALVEIYINYDCDRTSLDNVYERLLNIISRISTTQFTTVTPASTGKEGKEGKDLDSSAATTASWNTAMPFLPAIPATSHNTSLLSTSTGQPATDFSIPPLNPSLIGPSMPIETQLKRQSLECLVSVLRSLVAWAGRSPTSSHGTSSGIHGSSSSLHLADQGADTPSQGTHSRQSEDDADKSYEVTNGQNGQTAAISGADSLDDPGRFETAKLRKTTLLEGIKKFNYKPKRGVQFLLETGFIRSRQPQDIAAFLLHADGLSKAMIGEYLGEG
jgi:brefeldin A-inhibited guanine nucleotide-exchange protein